MIMKQIKIKIYLKSRRMPLTAIINSEDIIKKLIDSLRSDSVVEFGNVVFPASDFKFLSFYEK